jgi:hypothetical protein
MVGRSPNREYRASVVQVFCGFGDIYARLAAMTCLFL